MKHIAKNKLDVTADPQQKTYPLHTKTYLETAPAIKIFNLITFAGVFFSIVSDEISAEFFQSVKLFLIDRVHAVCRRIPSFDETRVRLWTTGFQFFWRAGSNRHFPKTPYSACQFPALILSKTKMVKRLLSSVLSQ